MGNAYFDEHFEEEWHNHNKSKKETSDESSWDDSSLEEAQPQEVETINVEEQDTKANISVSLIS